MFDRIIFWLIKREKRKRGERCLREHVNKTCILRGRVGGGFLNFFLLKIKKNAYNFLKQNNMQKYFVTFLQGYSFKTILTLEPNFFFFFKIIHFRLFLFQNYIHIFSIYTCKKKLARRGGGVGQGLKSLSFILSCSLSDRAIKILFFLLPCS